MTRYILHGGYTSDKNELNSGFYREISRYLPDGGNILVVYFAREPEEWQELFEEDKNNIRKEAGEKKLDISCASEENFMSELKGADAVYMRGGDTDKLLGVLKKYPDLKNLFRGKVVVGSSAGAYVLAMYYYSNTKGGVQKGLGILPIRVICHYKSARHSKDAVFGEEEDPVALMERYPNDLELVVLKDFEWKTLVENGRDQADS